MLEDNSKKIFELKKLISVLEWDLPNIKDKSLRLYKARQLQRYKKELEMLTITTEVN